MLNVNIIEFAGRRAVINSFSRQYPELIGIMNEQRETFAKRFPRATVETVTMRETDVIALVASPDGGKSWEIGLSSEKEG